MKRKRNILFYEAGTQGGGSFESLFQILKHIDREKFNPVVVFVNNTKYLKKIKRLSIKCYLITDALFSIHANPALRSIAYGFFLINWKLLNENGTVDCWIHHQTLKKIESIIVKDNIDLIHLNGQIARDHFIAYARVLRKIPIISYLRSQKAETRYKKRIIRVNPHISQYIAYSRWVGEIWQRVGVDRKKVEILHNSIDDEIIVTENIDLKSQYEISNRDCKVIGCIGNFDITRKYEFAIKSLRYVLNGNDNVKLLLVGGGDKNYRQTLIHLADDLGIRHHVVFGDRVRDAKPIIKALDALIIPYEHEPFGRIMLEAWMMKTPVILTDTGHIRDIVKHEITGLLVPYGNEYQMAKSIIRVLVDDSLRTKIVESALKECMARFSMKTYIRKLEHIYSSALG